MVGTDIKFNGSLCCGFKKRLTWDGKGKSEVIRWRKSPGGRWEFQRQCLKDERKREQESRKMSAPEAGRGKGRGRARGKPETLVARNVH